MLHSNRLTVANNQTMAAVIRGDAFTVLWLYVACEYIHAGWSRRERWYVNGAVKLLFRSSNTQHFSDTSTLCRSFALALSRNKCMTVYASTHAHTYTQSRSKTPKTTHSFSCYLSFTFLFLRFQQSILGDLL